MMITVSIPFITGAYLKGGVGQWCLFQYGLNPLHYRGLPQRKLRSQGSHKDQVSIPFITGAYLKGHRFCRDSLYRRSQSPSLPGLTSKPDENRLFPQQQRSQSPSLPGLTSKHARVFCDVSQICLNPLHYRGLPQRYRNLRMGRDKRSQSPSLPGLTSKKNGLRAVFKTESLNPLHYRGLPQIKSPFIITIRKGLNPLHYRGLPQSNIGR